MSRGGSFNGKSLPRLGLAWNHLGEKKRFTGAIAVGLEELHTSAMVK